jgi:hypothetical protein
MRVLPALLALLALSVSAGETLLPREGSGWDGFGVGAWVRLKTTRIPKGRVPSVTITKMRLLKATDKTLTLESSSRNPIGMETKKELSLPRRGEAAAGEKAKTETLDSGRVFATGKSFLCTKTRTTITGPSGKRVVTEWRSTEPRVRVKRVEETYDAEGKLSERFSIVLTSLDVRRKIGKREVRCLAYSTLRKAEDLEQRGKALVSRDVPGDTVRMDTDILRKGLVIFTIRVEALDFGLK